MDYTLPSHTLPSHTLPSRALLLIRDYSKPLTRPDWRKSKPLFTQFNIYLFSISRNQKWSKLKYNTFILITSTDWYRVFKYIKYYGLDKYYYNYGWNDVSHIDGMLDADNWYNNPSQMMW